MSRTTCRRCNATSIIDDPNLPLAIVATFVAPAVSIAAATWSLAGTPRPGKAVLAGLIIGVSFALLAATWAHTQELFSLVTSGVRASKLACICDPERARHRWAKVEDELTAGQRAALVLQVAERHDSTAPLEMPDKIVSQAARDAHALHDDVLLAACLQVSGNPRRHLRGLAAGHGDFWMLTNSILHARAALLSGRDVLGVFQVARAVIGAKEVGYGQDVWDQFPQIANTSDVSRSRWELLAEAVPEQKVRDVADCAPQLQTMSDARFRFVAAYAARLGRGPIKAAPLHDAAWFDRGAGLSDLAWDWIAEQCADVDCDGVGIDDLFDAAAVLAVGVST